MVKFLYTSWYLYLNILRFIFTQHCSLIIGLWNWYIRSVSVFAGNIINWDFLKKLTAGVNRQRNSSSGCLVYHMIRTIGKHTTYDCYTTIDDWCMTIYMGHQISMTSQFIKYHILIRYLYLYICQKYEILQMYIIRELSMTQIKWIKKY